MYGSPTLTKFLLWEQGVSLCADSDWFRCKYVQRALEQRVAVHVQWLNFSVWTFAWQNEAMRIVYRMRGLLGDATEDMVNSLDSGRGLFNNSHHKQNLKRSAKVFQFIIIIIYLFSKMEKYSWMKQENTEQGEHK